MAGVRPGLLHARWQALAKRPKPQSSARAPGSAVGNRELYGSREVLRPKKQGPAQGACATMLAAFCETAPRTPIQTSRAAWGEHDGDSCRARAVRAPARSTLITEDWENSLHRPCALSPFSAQSDESR